MAVYNFWYSYIYAYWWCTSLTAHCFWLYENTSSPGHPGPLVISKQLAVFVIYFHTALNFGNFALYIRLSGIVVLRTPARYLHQLVPTLSSLYTLWLLHGLPFCSQSSITLPRALPPQGLMSALEPYLAIAVLLLIVDNKADTNLLCPDAVYVLCFCLCCFVPLVCDRDRPAF